jgi:hypothetical protein
MTPVTNNYGCVILHTDNLILPILAVFESKSSKSAQFLSAQSDGKPAGPLKTLANPNRA